MCVLHGFGLVSEFPPTVSGATLAATFLVGIKFVRGANQESMPDAMVFRRLSQACLRAARTCPRAVERCDVLDDAGTVDLIHQFKRKDGSLFQSGTSTRSARSNIEGTSDTGASS